VFRGVGAEVGFNVVGWYVIRCDCFAVLGPTCVLCFFLPCCSVFDTSSIRASRDCQSISAPPPAARDRPTSLQDAAQAARLAVQVERDVQVQDLLRGG
jgi:hypothetical protein